MKSSKLQVKVVLWISLILFIFIGGSYGTTMYLTQRSLNQEYEEAVRRKAFLLMNAIYNNIASTTESGHMQQLIRMTELTRSYSGLAHMIIFSKDGIVRQSLDPHDVGKKASRVGSTYDVSAPFCLRRPLFNQERCHGCHDAERRVLGVFDVCLSMESTQERIARNKAIMRTAGVVSALATFILTTSAIALLVTVMGKQPGKREESPG